MGFSEVTYPSLASAIDARLPVEAEISKEKENAIVNDVISDLLGEDAPRAQTSTLPHASGSGTRREDFW
jgi:hypothetical protein